jgi:hypothetical protein
MIHVLTVHWEDERWIDVQLRYLGAHLTEPFRVYAFLNGVPDEHRIKYFYSSTEPIASHPVKLNLLADVASFNADGPDDWLLFIDGDAFPVADVVAFGREKLRTFPLAAIQRRENDGDIQPHPSFCLTTVGFWKGIGGDWKETRGWKNERGQTVHDVGGNLLWALNESGSSWYPMLRSNKVDLHPVFFAVYDDLVYHHGAGFRRAWSRADTLRASRERGWLWSLLPKRLRGLVTRPAAAENERHSAQIFREIVDDPLFYRRFTGG